jgi:DNA-binding LytR/AlgR family response regulator
MANYKVLIVEDELIVAKDIQHSLERIGYDVTGIASDTNQAIELMQETQPNVVLMDIMLRNGDSGIDTAEILRNDFRVPVIFLTAYADSVTLEKAKKAETYGYILKPFKAVDLQTNIELAVYKHGKELEVQKERDVLANYIDQVDSNSSDIFVRTNNKLIRLRKEHILFVEALKDYVILHLENKKYTIHTTMKDIETKLGSKEFVRIHRSFIVRLDKIESIELPNLRLEKDSHILPIGGSYKEDLFSRINMI